MKPHYLSTESFGLLLMLVSAILYSAAGVFVKLAAADGGLASTQLVFFRAIFQGFFVILAMTCSKASTSAQGVVGTLLIRRPFGARHVLPLVIFRGMLGAIGFVLYFYTMTVLPLGDAVSLLSLYPILTVFLARIFLGEAIHTLHILVAIASVAGAICIAQPTFIFGNSTSQQRSPPLGFICGILGSFCASGVVTLIRKAGTIGVHTLQLLLSWVTFGILFSILIGLHQDWKWPTSTRTWLYILAMCSIGSAAHFLLNHAGRIAPAGLASIVRSSDIMWAYGWEILVFGIIPHVWTWIGVGLVCLSLIAIAVQKVRDQRLQLVKQLSSVVLQNDNDTTLVVEEEEQQDLELQEEATCSTERAYAKVAASEED